MAVKFNVFNAETAMLRLGASQADVDWLKDHHVKVSLTSSHLIMAIPSEDFSETEAVYDIQLGLSVLVALKKGPITGAQADILKSSLTKMIETIKEKHGIHLANLDTPPEGWNAPLAHQGTLGKLPQLKTPLTYAEAQKMSGVLTDLPTGTGKSIVASEIAKSLQKTGWPTFDLSKIKTADLVKLRDATMMYQPVHGSSAGSRYFMIAGNQTLRVAARLKGGTLSIRIEGSNITDFKKQIEAVGFSKMSKSEQYASVHLDVGGDKILANKTLGAFLVGLGVSLDTPIPDLSLIA